LLVKADFGYSFPQPFSGSESLSLLLVLLVLPVLPP
jgi:hypothetical protein